MTPYGLCAGLATQTTKSDPLWMPNSRHSSHSLNRFAASFTRLLGGDRGFGVLLMLSAIAALALANSPFSAAYHDFFHHRLAWTPVPKLDTWHLWINDSLMAVFFFVVGLEIKREVIDGELSRSERRRLPVLAAIAGMAVPAAIFLTIAGSEADLRHGWGIPMATDIAFALGVLAICARGAPASLRLFLLTVAIVDDLGAVAVIAVFYTAQLNLAWLAGAAAVLAVMFTINRFGFSRARMFVPLAIVVWVCVLHSGVHATIAGVLAAFAIPMRLGADTHDSLLLRLEHALVPWNGYVIVPLFGLANAGVDIRAAGLDALLAPLPLGIAAGLFLGKQAAILLTILVAERTGFAVRPKGASLAQLWGVAALCGIGFTMSLFIGALAFPGNEALIEQAKIGVLAGTFLSVLVGGLILLSSRNPARPA
jgi:NhaA family Na+:H+ antiporter